MMQVDLAPRCVGVIDATDDEMQSLTDAGYQLPDMRHIGALEMLYELL